MERKARRRGVGLSEVEMTQEKHTTDAHMQQVPLSFSRVAVDSVGANNKGIGWLHRAEPKLIETAPAWSRLAPKHDSPRTHGSTSMLKSDTNLEEVAFPLWPPSRFEVFTRSRQESCWSDRPWTASSLQSRSTAVDVDS